MHGCNATFGVWCLNWMLSSLGPITYECCWCCACASNLWKWGIGDWWEYVRNSQTCEMQKKKKIYVKEKIIIHKTIFTWFGNLPTITELQGFHYSQRKIQSAAIQFFFFSLKNNIKKTLISKSNNFLYPTHKIHNEL